MFRHIPTHKSALLLPIPENNRARFHLYSFTSVNIFLPDSKYAGVPDALYMEESHPDLH